MTLGTVSRTRMLLGVYLLSQFRPYLSASRQIAADIAQAAPPGRFVILDAFCGVGGNTIAFALSGRWKRVLAIEKDRATLECAQANAKVYGVFDKISWFLGDCFEIFASEGSKSVPGLRQLVEGYGMIFASPPWGGKLLNLDLLAVYF